jgi:leucyl-tRNA synthetase
MQAHLQYAGARDAGWDVAVRALVRLLNPLAPHVCEEMWERLGEAGMLADSQWPEYDAAAAAVPEVTLVVQVAGKVRDRLTIPVGTSEEKALEAALASERVRAAFDGRRPSKVVYVPDRLINLVP